MASINEERVHLNPTFQLHTDNFFNRKNHRCVHASKPDYDEKGMFSWIYESMCFFPSQLANIPGYVTEYFCPSKKINNDGF